MSLEVVLGKIDYIYFNKKKCQINIKKKNEAIHLLITILRLIDNKLEKNTLKQNSSIELIYGTNKIKISKKTKAHDIMKRFGKSSNDYFLIHKHDVIDKDKFIIDTMIKDQDHINIKKIPEKGMTLFVKNLKNNFITIDISNKSSVEDISLLIFLKEKIPISMQQLFFSAKHITHKEILSDIGIKNENSIILNLSLKGGMFHISSCKIDYIKFKNSISQLKIELENDITNKSKEKLRLCRRYIMKKIKTIIDNDFYCDNCFTKN